MPFQQYFTHLLLMVLVLLGLGACGANDVRNPENFDLYNYLAQTDGAPSRAAESIHLIKDAAEKGDYHAQFKMGVYYYIGSGTTQNFKKAFDWFKKAADQADDSDMRPEFVVGVLYAKGQGTKQNLGQATTWFRIAGKAHDQDGELANAFLRWIKLHAANSPS